MANRLKILGVHGLGDHRNSTWKADWEGTIRSIFPGQPDIALDFEFITYDPIFEKEQISAWDTAQALWKLTSSAVTSTFRRDKGLVSSVSDRVRWTAGYVVAWVEEDSFKQATRKLVLDALRDYKPDLLLGHSLGSLVTFNAITHHQALDDDAVRSVMAEMRYITLGSQIANPFVVRNLTTGRVTVPAVKFWYHLFNKHDDVFTAPIRILDQDNFRQVETPFDNEGFGDHSAESYLSHRATVGNVWRPIAEETLAPPNAKAFGAMATSRTAPRPSSVNRRRKYKALLVGINDYPDPANRLEGCVNDVFRMSEVLQECGYPADSIRVCLNERATAHGILERLEWLLDDPRSDDEIVFFYSGHGAQIPEYGEDNEPDRNTETLVPFDFDWTPEHAITDDRIYSLYSQLPFDTRFAMIFDCCHSGGIHRAGMPRPKGLNPPDDIRHREIEWRPDIGMWVERGFKPLNKAFAHPGKGKDSARSAKETEQQFFGSNGATSRLGRASPLRGMSAKHYAEIKDEKGTSRFGPYLPLILEACNENESSYEYKHGVTSFGAFTFALSKILRTKRNITFSALIDQTRAQLADLKYAQTPQILGPRAIVHAQVPWMTATSASKKAKQRPRRKSAKTTRTTAPTKRIKAKAK